MRGIVAIGHPASVPYRGDALDLRGTGLPGTAEGGKKCLMLRSLLRPVHVNIATFSDFAIGLLAAKEKLRHNPMAV